MKKSMKLRKSLPVALAIALILICVCWKWGAFVATEPVFLSKSKINLEEGASTILKVQKTGSIKITRKTFLSSNNNVATVTQNGTITAKKAGKATINVTVNYKKGKKVKSSTLKCDVKVSEKASDASTPTVEATPTPAPETTPGADNQITATPAPTATVTASPMPTLAPGQEGSALTLTPEQDGSVSTSAPGQENPAQTLSPDKEKPTPSPSDSIVVPVRDAGLYDAQGNLIKTWKKLLDKDAIEVSDGVVIDCDKKLAGELVIDDNIVSIDDSAFSDCSALTSITIPEGVTDISGYAFFGCSGLKSIRIPKSVTSIGVRAFSCCSGLTSIHIPEGVTNIGEYVFSFCSGLSSISVAAGNTTYHSNNSCNAIIETATNKLLVGCKNTEIPDGVKSIGRGAFICCRGLTSIRIPAGVTNIGVRAFFDCSDLTSITIPEEVTSIGDEAFTDCSGLTSIRIPERVTSIGYYAFSGCSGLADISVATDNTIYNSHGNCNAIIKTATNELLFGCKNTIIPDDVTSISLEAFRGCSGLTSIIIPESVTSIGSYAFEGCSGLTSISIPAGVTIIGSGAFSDCSGLAGISVATDNTTYNSHGNCNAIIKTATNKLLFGCKNTKIPAGVTRIGDEAFRGCSGLTSIDIPSSVTNIESWAFAGCSGLTSIFIPTSVTSIDSWAFREVPLVIYDGDATNYSNWGATAVERSNGKKLYPFSYRK